MYDIKVVWMGTVLGDASISDFEEYFLETLGFHVKYEMEFKMIGGDYEGLNCIVFNLCNNDVSKFTLFRLTTGDMKWLDDFCNNYCENIPIEILSKYDDYLN